MKTSNKLLLTAILIIIVSMVTYDFALRAEYLKGTYKSRFYEMKKLNLENFTILDNRVANIISVQIEYGKSYAVYMNNDLKNNLLISKNGNKLLIDVADKAKPIINPYNNNVIIICPKLDQVITRPDIRKSIKEWDNDNGTTSITGFDQQNMDLFINTSTHLNFEKNKIGHLQATVGNNLSQHAYLFIASNNQIKDAVIKVMGKNQLNIENPKIIKSTFDISDSATVSLGGSILKQLKQQ